MGKWATYQRRGSATVPPSSELVLTDVGDANLAWTWLNSDPFSWRLQQSADEGATWSDWDSPAGNTRFFFGVDTGFSYRIQGRTEDNDPTTPWSNTVLVP